VARVSVDVDGKVPIWIKLCMDGGHIDIARGEADLPFIVTYKRQRFGLMEEKRWVGYARQDRNAKLTIRFHMPCIGNNFKPVPLVNRDRDHIRLYGSGKLNDECVFMR